MTERTPSTTWPFSLFGGVTGLSRATGFAYGTVYRWYDDSKIKEKYRDSVIAAARRLDPPVHITRDELANMAPNLPEALAG